MGVPKTCMLWAVVAGLLTACAWPPSALPAEEPEVLTLADQWFKLIDLKSGRRIGARHLVVQQKGQALTVRQQLAMAQEDKSVGYTVTVRYAAAALTPVSADVLSNVEGKPYLKGQVKFEGRRLQLTSTITGEDGRMVEPERTEEKALPEEGLVLLSQGLEVLAPALLPMPGRLEGIVFAECPAELDVLISIKSGYRLERRELADGTSKFRLFEGTSDEPLWQCLLDEEGATKETTFYETRSVPASRAEATRPVGGD